MLTKRTKLVIVGCLSLFGLLLCFCMAGAAINFFILNAPQEVRRSVDITIDTKHRQEFFDQLRKFADKHAFTIQIDTRSSGAENFSVYMHREDIIISGANVFAVGEYQLAFYDADRLRPAPESVFDDLVTDLESFVSEVPGVTFSIKK